MMPAAAAFAKVTLGRIEQRRQADARAEALWREARRVGEELENKRLVFTADFYRYRAALENGKAALAASLRKSLDRLAPWVPEHVIVRAQFEALRVERLDRPLPRRRRPLRDRRPTPGID